jgi:hypothetical protein
MHGTENLNLKLCTAVLIRVQWEGKVKNKI